MVETGSRDPRRRAHDHHDFMVYGIAMLAYWGGWLRAPGRWRGPLSTLGGYDKLAHEVSITIAGKRSGALFGAERGFFLTGVAYTAPVFATTCVPDGLHAPAATIPTGPLAERWKVLGVRGVRVFVGAVIYPIYANWTWGGGWLAHARQEPRARARERGFRGILRRAHDGRR